MKKNAYSVVVLKLNDVVFVEEKNDSFVDHAQNGSRLIAVTQKFLPKN